MEKSQKKLSKRIDPHGLGPIEKHDDKDEQ